MQSFELSGKHTHEINPFVAVGRRSQLDLFAPCTPLESQTIHSARTQEKAEVEDCLSVILWRRI